MRQSSDITWNWAECHAGGRELVGRLPTRHLTQDRRRYVEAYLVLQSALAAEETFDTVRASGFTIIAIDGQQPEAGRSRCGTSRTS